LFEPPSPGAARAHELLRAARLLVGPAHAAAYLVPRCLYLYCVGLNKSPGPCCSTLPRPTADEAALAALGRAGAQQVGPRW
jgi:hypothetical protein